MSFISNADKLLKQLKKNIKNINLEKKYKLQQNFVTIQHIVKLE